MSSHLDALFAPTSIAVIGASDDPSRIGGRPLAYIKNGPFSGPLYPINPRRETVQGLTAYPDIRATPAPADLAIVAVPAARVLETLAAAAASGVRAAVVFSSGFAEMGESGEAAQAAIKALCKDTGLRVLGPNCLGAYNAGLGVYATFSTTIELYTPQPGPVAIVSQSGAFGAHVATIAKRRGINAGLWVTTGNEADVSVSECIGWMAGREEVRVICAYAEGIQDGDAFLDACDQARAAGKRIVLVKVGRSAAGAEAARSHTAALAGSDRVFDAVVRQHGICRVEHIEEMLDLAYAASFEPLPASNRAGLLSISGGAGVHMADVAEAVHLTLPQMPEAAQARLKALLPFASPRNPVDITAQVFNEPELIATFVESMAREGNYAGIIAFFSYVASVDFLREPVFEAMRQARASHPDVVMFLSMMGPPDLVARYEALGIGVFEDPVRAVKALAGLTRIAEGLACAPRQPRAGATGDGQRYGGDGLDEHEAAQLLASWGVSMAPAVVARSAAEAAAAAADNAGPVVVKLLSPDVAHKTEVGGVRLDIDSPQAAAAAHEAIVAAARQLRPDARITGTLVAPMCTGGLEAIIGTQNDPTFGPVVMVGLGGVLTEVLGDVCFARAPVTPAAALGLVRALRGAALLDGVRGGPALDAQALATTVAAVSRFAAAHADSVASVDLNPVLVRPRGEGVVALDALIQGRTSEG